MRVVSLGSGSSGNALLVEAGPLARTKLLVDAGLSTRTLTERLLHVGVHPSQLQAVLVTHEHSDHVIGLPTLLKRYPIAIITDTRTYEAIKDGINTGMWRTDSGALSSRKGDVPDSWDTGETTLALDNFLARTVSVGEHCTVGDIQVTSFATSHDAVAPCGYLLQAGGCRVCIVTDTGEVTSAMLDSMQHADLLILESNHDRERLLSGPYPYALKQRILSPTGHLSNDQAADAILRTWRSDGLRWLWLAHISRTNNTPTLALSSVRARLQAAHANLLQVHLSVLPPTIGKVWDSTQLWQAPSLWEMQV